MGFYIKAEYELIIIALVVSMISLAVIMLPEKIFSILRKRACHRGEHIEYITESNYYYSVSKCACGEKQTLTSKT